jgi:hypothetical protein
MGLAEKMTEKGRATFYKRKNNLKKSFKRD